MYAIPRSVVARVLLGLSGQPLLDAALLLLNLETATALSLGKCWLHLWGSKGLVMDSRLIGSLSLELQRSGVRRTSPHHRDKQVCTAASSS